MTRALSRYAIFCAFATFCLIIAGALVTSTGSGLSVPTWPFAPHHLLPPLVGGVLFEYGHRMVAGTVILLTLILAIWLFKVGANKVLKNLALAAIAAIFLQAALGGATVLLGLPPAISLAHAGLAQLFFCIMCAMAYLSWTNLEPPEKVGWNSSEAFLTLTLATPLLLYAQILAGALVRHIGAALSIPDFPMAFGHFFPPLARVDFPVIVNFVHTRAGALLATALTAWTAVLALQSPSKEIRKTGAISLILLLVQVLLGMTIIWSWRNVVPTTAHVAVGALLLAANVVLALEARTLLKTREIAPQAELLRS